MTSAAAVIEARAVMRGDVVGGGDLLVLQRRLDEALDAGRRRITLDLGGVAIAGPQTEVLLCRALRRLTRSGAAVTIVGVDRRVSRILELCEIEGLNVTAPGAPAVVAG